MGIEGFKDETVITDIGTLEGISEKEPAVDFLGGPAMGQQVILPEGDSVIGRSKDATVVVEDEAISRYHFKIKVREKIATIEDLNSTNGTYVNGMRIKQQVLKANDKIQISSATVLRFSYVDLIDKNSHERFYEMALYDPVTTAHTKRYFLDRIQHEFAHSARRNLPLSLMIYDLDFFKKVNDTYGHPAGDFILQKVSETTKTMIRREDIFARYGGEEFVILLPETGMGEALDIAERIRTRIAAEVFHGRHMTVSIGVAEFPLHGETADHVVGAADEALYEAKREGRDKVRRAGLKLVRGKPQERAG